MNPFFPTPEIPDLRGKLEADTSGFSPCWKFLLLAVVQPRASPLAPAMAVS